MFEFDRLLVAGKQLRQQLNLCYMFEIKCNFCDFLGPGNVSNLRFFEMLLLRNRVIFIHYRLNSDSRRKIISLLSLFAVRLQCFGTALVHTRFRTQSFETV